MPVFHFRLEARDGSGQFRRGRVAADTEAEAREILLGRELANAGYRLTTEELAEILERKKALEAAGARLGGADRGKLALHEQAELYELVYLGKAPPADASPEGGE